MPLEKKIFSIRVLKNNLKKERENLLLEIENYNKIMMPKNFLELKKNIEKKYEYFKDIEDFNFQKELINLQKQIIKCMYLDISSKYCVLLLILSFSFSISFDFSIILFLKSS